MVSVQPGAAISEAVSKTRVVLAVVRTGRFRILGSLKPRVQANVTSFPSGRCHLVIGLEDQRSTRSRPVYWSCRHRLRDAVGLVCRIAQRLIDFSADP